MIPLTDDAARQRTQEHHRHLAEAVAKAVAAFERACLDGDPPAARAAADLFQSLLEGEIVPQVVGEEHSLYAAAEPLNLPLVRSLIDEHDLLRGLIATCALRAATRKEPAARLAYLGLAHATSTIFDAHARKEGRYLTPLLSERMPAGTLAQLFGEMNTVPPGYDTTPCRGERGLDAVARCFPLSRVRTIRLRCADSRSLS